MDVASYGNKNRYYCNQKALSGPDRYVFAAAVGGTIIPLVCWMIFEAPWHWVNTNPAIPVLQGIMGLYALVFQFIVAFTDPGIVPRRSLQQDQDESGDPWAITRRLPATSKKITINGTEVVVKWCKTCSLYRPPRAIHCGTCDNCVDTFDHHCPWVGNCVGKRNYRWFLLYTGFVSTLACFTLGTAVAKLAIIALRGEPVAQNGMFWSALVYILYSIPVVGFTGFLWYYHLFISCLGLTTNERLKRLYRTKPNPYSKGCGQNLLVRFCGYQPSRFIKFHVSEELPAFPESREAAPQEGDFAGDEEAELERQFELLQEYL